MKRTQIMRVSQVFAFDLKKLHQEYNAVNCKNDSFCAFTEFIAKEHPIKLNEVKLFVKKERQKK